jgi:hypothetical protein
MSQNVGLGLFVDQSESDLGACDVMRLISLVKFGLVINYKHANKY